MPDEVVTITIVMIPNVNFDLEGQVYQMDPTTNRLPGTLRP